uniref:Uncharacterized protein n=1 Tax=Candidatus Kentrum sp. FW TaxID=2126338 RepID=A0A450U1J4_9GAMM|nr:MAG: hypothetical protein BECKFW1821C_GA0114237_11016 [Candidatus Kentron sp. FW]
MSNATIQELRRAIIEALPSDTSIHGKIPERKAVYVPPSHLRALRSECYLVIGWCGVGKTFWSRALASAKIRRMIGHSVSELAKAEVHPGFGEAPNLDFYPDSRVFDSLVQRFKAYDVWQAVLARWVAEVLSEEIPHGSWKETTEWIMNRPEPFARMLERVNARFEEKRKIGMIVFDALDRVSFDWQTMDDIVRDLLRVVLSLKGFSNLHAKIFLREDQFDGRRVTDFPDASKLLATRVELTWSPQDLHGLLWQHLCNGDGNPGEILRDTYEKATGSSPPQPVEGVWTISDPVKRDTETQRALFTEIAGERMGRDHRRGVPYIWTVGYLADGRGRTSPRSFLAAIRGAAEDSRDRYPDYRYPLHYESIKRGVQKASEIRVSELAEDYPWVRTVMGPLHGLSVPCGFDIIEQRWKEKWGKSMPDMQPGLPPEHHEQGWVGIRQDLEGLGIFQPMRDGRVNMPDLYRVGFGLGRRGGVKPVVRKS